MQNVAVPIPFVVSIITPSFFFNSSTVLPQLAKKNRALLDLSQMSGFEGFGVPTVQYKNTTMKTIMATSHLIIYIAVQQ
jgi:hypothetical protein